MNSLPSNVQRPTSIKVAVVHDWLVGGGAEKVVEQLHKLYPDALIYTSYCTPEWRKRLDYKVITGPLQAWPFSKLRKFIPFLRVWWFSSLNLSKFDLIISSCGNGEAFGVHKRPDATHICYCHSPTHFYWRHYDQYSKTPGFGVFNPVARLGLKLFIKPLRTWDYKAAQRPDAFIANSTHIKNDIKKFYGRDAEVIHPPVDTKRFEVRGSRLEVRNGFVTAGRLVPYKRTDIIVKACSELNLPLKVIGKGPELANLKKIAGPTVEFLGFAPNEELPGLFAGAEAFLFAAFEDFGIVPVEAMAAGTPVIALKAGGALDYVIPGKTGEFFEEQSVESLQKVIKSFGSGKYDSAKIKKAAEAFSEERFREKISDFVNAHIPAKPAEK